MIKKFLLLSLTAMQIICNININPINKNSDNDINFFSSKVYAEEKVVQNENNINQPEYSVILPKRVDVTKETGSFNYYLVNKGLSIGSSVNISFPNEFVLKSVNKTDVSGKFSGDLNSKILSTDGQVQITKTINYNHGALTAGNWKADISVQIKPNLFTYVLSNGKDINTQLKTLDATHKISSVEFVKSKMPATATPITGLDADGDGGIVGWYTINGTDNKAKVYISSQYSTQNIIANTTLSNMFEGLTELTSVQFNGNLDTSSTADFSKLFHQCSKLKTVDVNTLNMQNATTIYRMFAFCSSLSEVNFNGWNTPKLTDIGSLFLDCSSLERADLRNINVAKVTKMSSIFQNCEKINYLDLTGWNTMSANTMRNMFHNVSRTATNLVFKGYENFDTRNLDNAKMVFFGFAEKNPGKYQLDLSKWDFSKVTTIESIFYGTNAELIKLPKNINKTVNTTPSTSGKGVTSINWLDTTDNVVYSTGTLPLGFATSHTIIPNITYQLVEGSVVNSKLMSINNTSPIKSVEFVRTAKPATATEIAGLDADNDGGIVGWYNVETDGKARVYISTQNINKSVVAHEQCNTMFANLASLDTVKFNNNFDTSTSTSFFAMFSKCSVLTNIDINTLNTSKVQNMYRTFEGCSALTELNLSSWNTASLTEIGSLFKDCTNLKRINLSNWDTTSISSMRSTFHNCVSLTDLDLSTWNTPSLINLSSTFFNCNSLNRLDLKNFNVSNVTNLSGTFQNCLKLNYLDISSWSTPSLTTIKSTFQNVGKDSVSLTLKGIDTLNTSNVTNARYAFFGLGRNNSNKLKLDLSKWDFSKVTEMQSMFYLANLSEIKTPINISSNVNINPSTGEDPITNKTWYDKTDNKEYLKGTFPIGNGNVSHMLVDKLDTYKVTLTSNNSNFGYVSGDGTYNSGSLVRIDAIPYRGYKFSLWSDGDTNASRTITVNKDINLQAIFYKPVSIGVSLNDYYAGNVDGSDSGEFKEGDVITLSATANKGYQFVGWYEGSVSGPLISNKSTVSIIANKSTTYFAVFKKNTSNINVNLNVYTDPYGSGTISLNGTVSNFGTYPQGSYITMEAVPKTGYAFDGWYKGSANGIYVGNNSSITVVLNQNESYYAKFRKTQAKISIGNTINGNVTQSGNGTYNIGENVTLTANPDYGYKFDRWIDEYGTTISYSNPYTFAINDDINITPVMKETYKNITYELVDGPTISNILNQINNRNTITSIEFVDTVKPTSGITEITGLDADNDGGVVGWYIIEPYVETSKVYISTQTTGQKTIANRDSSRMFVMSSSSSNMIEHMDVSKLDVSNVENFSMMFGWLGCGHSSTGIVVNLDLSSWTIRENANIENMFLKNYDISKRPYGLLTIKLPAYIPSSVRGATYIGYGKYKNLDTGISMTIHGDITPFLPVTYSQTIELIWGN